MSDRIDISDYLLGELSGEELAEAERLMREDPGFRAEVERLRPAVQSLEELPREAWEDLEPPPLAIGGSTASRPEPSRPKSRWWRPFALRPAFAALASVMLLAVGVGVGVLLADTGTEGPAAGGRTLALEPVDPRGSGATGSAELIGGGGGEAVVHISGVSPNAPGEFYELWLLSSPDDLVSLGSFKVGSSGEATVRVPLPVDPAEFEFIDLSVERDDGDASHSGRSVLRAPT
jgi:anti-sigma-K factor RskA